MQDLREAVSSRKQPGLCSSDPWSRRRGAASGATGAEGGASLARCGRRRNSLCPFLAAATPHRPLHVDEAAGLPALPAFSPPLRPRGLQGPLLGSDGGRRRIGGLQAEHRGAREAVQGLWRTSGLRRWRRDLGIGSQRHWGTRSRRPPAKLQPFALPSESGILGALCLPPQRHVQQRAPLKDTHSEGGVERGSESSGNS